MGARAICVCGDHQVRAVVADALSRAGVTCEHHDRIPEAPGPRVIDGPGPDSGPAPNPALIVVDRATRQDQADQVRASAVPVVVVGDDLDDDGLITLMLEAPVSHLVGDPGDRDLGITSEKLVSGDLFGLEKYVAAGSQVGERRVTTDEQKRAAIAEVCAWAEGIGARRPIVHRLASVVDELLMNALHDAPRESKPTMSWEDIARGSSPNLDEGRAVLRWACDDHAIAISVGDGYGALSQRDVIDHVRRARDERGRPQPVDEPGAGLGLYLVLANVASLIVNVDPGHRTEVVCLFDRTGRDRVAIESAVRSLHVFSRSA